MAEINKETIKKPQLHVVFFTFDPQFKLEKFDGGTQTDAENAVAEAETMALTLESNIAPFESVLMIRALLFGSCLYIAKSLETHLPDAQMIRDIYPYARMIEGKKMEHLFMEFGIDLKLESPEIFQSIFGGQADEK